MYGKYEILIGASSRDIRLSETIELSSSQVIPMHIHMNTTLGELFNNPNTKEAAKELTSRYLAAMNGGLKKKNENLAAYQMAAEVMDRVGIHEGTVFRYHQARRNTRNYQVDLETLQYDLLYGKRYSYGESGESPYLRTRMRMGIYDVTLDSIQCISEADHTYYIKGTEFTPSSEIKLNGEWYDTVYINPTN